MHHVMSGTLFRRMTQRTGLVLTMIGLCSLIWRMTSTSAQLNTAPTHFARAQLPMDSPPLLFASESLRGLLQDSLEFPIRAKRPFDFELLRHLDRYAILQAHQAFRIPLEWDTARALQERLARFGSLTVRLDRDTAEIHPSDNIDELQMTTAERNFLIRLLAYDARRGVFLHHESIGLQMYLLPINNRNLRYFSVNSDGSFSDRSYKVMCDLIAQSDIIHLLLRFLAVVKGGFAADENWGRSPQEDQTLFDMIGIMMAEEFRRVAETNNRKSPSRIDPLDLFKTSLSMLSLSKDSEQFCRSVAGNFIQSRSRRRFVQRLISANLRAHSPELTRQLPRKIGHNEKDIIEAIARYAHEPKPITIDERASLQLFLQAVRGLAVR